MADIRFKINGSSSPFKIEVYDDEDNLITNKFVEYSGISTLDRENQTCVVINCLTPDKTYNIKGIDSIGNEVVLSVDTSQVVPVSPTISTNLQLLGTIYNPSENVQSLNPSLIKSLEISPVLVSGQCIDLTLSGCSSFGTTDTAFVEVFKRCGSSGSYNLLKRIQNCSSTINTSIGVGDDICYVLSSQIEHANNIQCYSFACAALEISSASIISGIDNLTCGPITCLSVNKLCCTTTTTTTEAPTSIQVFWGPQQTTSLTNELVSGYVPLCTSPALQAGQSFRIGVIHCVKYCYQTYIDSPIDAKSYSLSNSVIQGCADLNVTCTTNGPFSDGQYVITYLDVNCSNINNIRACVIAENENLAGLNALSEGCAKIALISNQVGGTYSIYTGESINCSCEVKAFLCSNGSGGVVLQF